LSKSPTKRAAAAGQTISGDHGKGASGEEKGLSSPTSVSMQNSFIIKNADESFDLYYQQMKRRRHLVSGFTQNLDASGSPGAGATMGQATGAGGVLDTSKNTSFQRGRKPNARDGHSANVDKFGFMFVFGGDRHQMPFNDLFLLKLPSK
jgi:hypothetical protein